MAYNALNLVELPGHMYMSGVVAKVLVGSYADLLTP
jgi:hypothetical protein